MLISPKKCENSDEMPQNEAFHQGIHCLLLRTSKIFRERNIYLGMITCDPLMFTMDLPKFIVSNQKEKSINVYKKFKMPMAVNLSLLSGPVVVFDTVHKIA